MSKVRKNLSNLIGWSTDRKIIIIESDDWGSIRIRSKKDFDVMLAKGLELDRSIFTSYDCLESNNDLMNLFEILYRHIDSTGRPIVFTPMCIMANPYFEKIKESGFSEYHYENFIDTCKRYPNHDKVLQLWHQGIEKRLFVPGFHGREHLNVNRWLKILQNGDQGLLIAFEHQSIGATFYKGEQIPEYLGAFHPDSSNDLPALEKVMETGVKLFKTNCRFEPTHFVAPNRESPKELDFALNRNGIRFLTTSKIRRYPLGNEKYKTEYNWLGKQNEVGQVIITRNCGFEPSDPIYIDWVDVCLKEIENAFKWRRPAVISSHRVNYISTVNPGNANKGLKELDRLLSVIIKKWPNVEFLTSSELGETILTEKNFKSKKFKPFFL